MLYPASPLILILFLAGIAIVSYLFGSVNFAIVWTRVFLHDDIRKYGSGNAGMTNVLRTVGKGAAALTLLGDIAKGVLSVLVAQLVFTLLIPDPFFCVMAKYLAAFGALMGHLFPLYYGFKGGKGVAVSAGAMLMLAPWVFLCCLGVFLLAVVLTRYVSLGSILSAVAYPVFIFLFGFFWTPHPYWVLETACAAVLGIIVIAMHHENIGRLIHGTERKIGEKKEK